MKRTCLLLLIAFYLCSCASSPVEIIGPIYSPSELNERGKELDGANVTVHGYVIHEHEAYGVWNSEEAAMQRDATQCVSLLYPQTIKSQVMGANRKLVYLRGVFRRNVTEEGGLFLGLCNFSGVSVNSLRHDRIKRDAISPPGQ